MLILSKTKYSSRETSDIIDFYFSYVSTRVHFAYVFFKREKKKAKRKKGWQVKEKEIQQIEKLDKREKEGIPISNNKWNNI